MSRRQVKQEVKKWGAYDFDGPLPALMVELQDLQDLHKDVALRLDSEYTQDYGDSERSFVLTCYYMRDETDEEVARREEQEADMRAFRRRQFEALKKEFGE